MSDNAAWTTARADCQGDGADLVVVDDAAEAAGIAALVQDPVGNSPFIWTGVFDPQAGGDNNWTTVLGGPATYLPFASGEPSGGNQNCLLLDDQGAPHRMYDFTCNANQIYVCECLP